MFTASVTVIAADVSKTTEERFQPDHSGYGLTLAGIGIPFLAAPFDGGLVF